jgi:arylsulfatase A-like enzyme
MNDVNRLCPEPAAMLSSGNGSTHSLNQEHPRGTGNNPNRSGARAGIVHGASDARAGAPARDPVSMEDLAATLFAAMGLDPEALVQARDGRPMPVTRGQVVQALLR